MQIYEAFNVEYFEQEGRAEDRSSSSSQSSLSSTSRFYLNLPYATVCLRVSMTDLKPRKACGIFEQIHTASRDVLRAHSSFER